MRLDLGLLVLDDVVLLLAMPPRRLVLALHLVLCDSGTSAHLTTDI